MIAAQIRHAHAGPRTTPRFVEAPVPLPTPSPVTTAAVRRVTPVPGSDGPIERKPVRVVSVSKDGETIPEGDDDEVNSKTVAVHSLSSKTAQTPMPISPAGIAPEGKFVTFAPPPVPAATASASAQASPEAGPAAVLAALAPEATTPAARQAMTAIDAATKKPEGWIVQIGAFPTEELARTRLEDARGHAGGLLSKGSPYTEITSQGSTKLYRARFAGFDEATAREACNRLKKNDFSCFTTRN
jgi:D-alanyl-D-alanine carboxypeptidase